MDYPKTRMDNFFAKAAGSELADNDMEPITDREYWINEMAAKIAQGGGGGGGGATIVECVYDDDAHTLTSSITAKELWDAYADGGAIITFDDSGYTNRFMIMGAAMGGGNPGYVFIYGDGRFFADSDTDYPVANLE